MEKIKRIILVVLRMKEKNEIIKNNSCSNDGKKNRYNNNNRDEWRCNVDTWQKKMQIHEISCLHISSCVCVCVCVVCVIVLVHVIIVYVIICKTMGASKNHKNKKQ